MTPEKQAEFEAQRKVELDQMIVKAQELFTLIAAQSSDRPGIAEVDLIAIQSGDFKTFKARVLHCDVVNPC